MPSAPIRVLIADDHALVRSGLRTVLERDGEFKVVGEAADGHEAIELAMLQKPDLVLLDVGMPRISGTDAAEQLTAKLPGTKIVVVSMHSDEAYVLRALKAGARGYILKASPEADVLAAARAVASGHAYFSPAIARMLVDDYVAEIRRRGFEDSYDLLSLREKEVLRLLVSGKNNREIADLLFVSPATVETHRNAVLRKLHLHSLPELILYAVRKGLVS